MTEGEHSSEGDASTQARAPTVPPTPSPSSSDDHDTSGTVRRLVIITAILIIGIAAFVWGRKLFPTEQAITSIPSYSVNIQEGGSPGALAAEFLSFKRQSDGTIIIQSTADIGFTSTNSGQFSSFDISLNLLGPHIIVIQCSRRGSCYTMNGPSGRETVISFSASSSGQQIETAVIRDPSFGFTENSESALAEMPYVDLVSLPSATSPSLPTSLNSNPFSLSIGYDIPEASAYDWSMPPQSINSNEATWAETINLVSVGGQAAQARGTAQAVDLTGSDEAVQAIHNQDTFVSGVLFGVAGAAALAALLEFLHLIFRVE